MKMYETWVNYKFCETILLATQKITSTWPERVKVAGNVFQSEENSKVYTFTHSFMKHEGFRTRTTTDWLWLRRQRYQCRAMRLHAKSRQSHHRSPINFKSEAWRKSFSVVLTNMRCLGKPHLLIDWHFYSRYNYWLVYRIRLTRSLLGFSYKIKI